MRRASSSASSRPGSPSDRAGAASLDYVLIMGIILPLAAFVLPAGRRMVSLVYEMFAVLVAWPFM